MLYCTTEMKRLQGFKSIKLYDIIKGACGTIMRGTNNTFNEIFDKHGANAMRLCQRATILGTLNIFRSILGHTKIKKFTCACLYAPSAVKRPFKYSNALMHSSSLYAPSASIIRSPSIISDLSLSY